MRNIIFFLILTINNLAFAEEEKELNIYNWANYIPQETIVKFEKETGIKVTYDVYDSNYMMEAKLIASVGGYDLVFPTVTPFMENQIRLGLYQPINKKKLSNYKNLDKEILNVMARGNPKLIDYAIPYMWGTLGIGYNEDKIKEIMPNGPLDSLKLFFDPEIVKSFTKCGVDMLDSPADMFIMMSLYLGTSPNSEDKNDLKLSEQAFKKIRPYLTTIHSSRYVDNLANGDSCLAFGYSGEIINAKFRAIESGNNVKIKYVYPKEGSELGIDAIGLLSDAPHPDNAHKFINFLLRPDIIAEISNQVGWMPANKAAYKLLSDNILGDEGINLSPEKRNKLFKSKVPSPELRRLRTRAWMRVINKSE